MNKKIIYCLLVIIAVALFFSFYNTTKAADYIYYNTNNIGAGYDYYEYQADILTTTTFVANKTGQGPTFTIAIGASNTCLSFGCSFYGFEVKENGNVIGGSSAVITDGGQYGIPSVFYCFPWGGDINNCQKTLNFDKPVNFQAGHTYILSYHVHANTAYLMVFYNLTNKYLVIPHTPSPDSINLTNLGQFKSDGTTPISEGVITTEDSIVLSANASSSAGFPVKLEVELRPVSESFIGQANLSSDFSTLSILTVSTPTLSDGQYHWQARAIDSQGTVSAWQEFGTPGNVDFVLQKLLSVPIFYQNVTNNPLDPDWPAEKLGYETAATIGQGGCALTSVAMLLNYYGANTAPGAGEPTNPHSLNQWLLKPTVNGYLASTGLILWDKLNTFSNKVSYFYDNSTFNCTADNLGSCTTAIDSDLSLSRPVIIKTFNQQKSINHYVVAKGKSINTWYINDPNKSVDAPTLSHRAYSNIVYGLRRFQSTTANILNSIDFTIASPADLLITDSQGRKTGYDPITQTNYNEIPNSIYYSERLDNDETGTIGDTVKVLHIGSSEAGAYNIQVIGTGTGEYHFSVNSSDINGSSAVSSFTGQTQPNLTVGYLVNYASQSGQPTTVVPADSIPPATTISLSGVQGNNNWYTSDVQIVLLAIDNPGGVGVYKTEYSLDNGQTWIAYVSPLTISQEGTSTLLYHSWDFVGNLEQTKSQIIQIDKTPPQLQLTANPSVLWPVNHKLVNVTIGGSASDIVSGIDSVVFQVIDEYGKVQPAILNFGDTIKLEAWRNGNDLDGRLYTISATATDKAGNQNTISINVTVPHDQRR